LAILTEPSWIDPLNVLTLGVLAVPTFVAFLASYLPARRATRVDPLDCLRID
jgi:ABC-type lipoprotein release transport system permease subunit